MPYGGFLAARLQPGETVLVNGATGSFGSAAVAVALGMGAALRHRHRPQRERRLADLVRRFGARVRTVTMRGDEADDRKRILQAAPGPIDCVLDILPPAANAMQVRTAILAVRPYGRVVLMGGVGMLGGAGLDLPYPWMMRNCITLHGQWMYPPHATILMAGLIRAGLVNLDHFEVTAFDLDHANEAVAHAARQQRPVQDDGDRAAASAPMIERQAPDRALAPMMSWTSSGLSTWVNHSARLAARRRPRSSSGSFNWRNRLVTSSRAVTWPMLGRVPSVASSMSSSAVSPRGKNSR